MPTTTHWLRTEPFAVPPDSPSDERLLRGMGKRMAAYRVAKGWNQTELGKKAGFRQETISRWETGTTQPTVLEAVALARALKVTLDDLVLGRK